MKITKDTVIKDLSKIGIVDNEVCYYLTTNGYLFVRDLLERTNDSIFRESLGKDVQAFALFLQCIIDYNSQFESKLWEYENDDRNEAIESLLPKSFLFSFHIVSHNLIERFKVERILVHKCSTWVLFFIYQLFTSPQTLLETNSFIFYYKKPYCDLINKNQSTVLKLPLFFMLSLIVGLNKSLDYFHECKYFNNLIRHIIDDLCITDELIFEAESITNTILTNNIKCESEIINKVKELPVQIEERLQKKYEEMQQNLSVRARNVINSNIPLYVNLMPWVLGENKFFPFKKCGKKTILELENLVKDFRDYYFLYETKKTLDNSTNDNYLKTLSFLLETATENQKSFEEYQCLMKIYSTWHDFSKDMYNIPAMYEKIFNHSPKITLDCLKWLSRLFGEISRQIYNQDGYTAYISDLNTASKKLTKIIEDNIMLLEYHKYISDTKELLIKEVYEQFVINSSNQCRHILENNCINYKDILSYRDVRDFQKLPQVGRKCAEEMYLLRARFQSSYTKILKDDEENVIKTKLLHKFPFLSKEDLVFVNNYEVRYSHFPLFYILLRYFATTQNRKEQILSSYFGLDNDFVVSLDGLSKKYNLTKERIRQILANKEKCFDSNNINLLDSYLWKSYNIEPFNYISISHPQYNKICEEECVSLSFYSYCSIQSLFNNVFVINFSEHGNVLTVNDLELFTTEGKKVYTYACSIRFQLFNFSLAFKEIRRLVNISRDVDLKIPLYIYFITNSDYWTKGNQPKDESDGMLLLSFIESVVSDLFGDIIVNHCLVLKANKRNYSDELYRILKHKGEIMHINEIFAEFCKISQDEAIKSPNNLRRYLLKDKRFTSIGKSSNYQLSEWGYYSGSITELILEVLSKYHEPQKISDLSKELIKHRPDSTERSVTSLIYLAIKEGKLVHFYGDYVGLPSNNYDPSYVILPNTFNEWLSAFKSFVLQHQCFPIGNALGFEGALYNWYYDTRRYIGLSTEEILSFHAVLQELQLIPHNLIELKFLKNVEAYKSFVKQTGRMLTKSDLEDLYQWYNRNVERYNNYEDNRKIYFKDLIDFLRKELEF